MVGFHALLALQNIGIDGALRQEFHVLELLRLLLKDLDELRADDPALGLRVGHAGEPVQKAVGRVHIDEVGVHLAAEHLHHLLGLALAQQAVVHMHTDELLADGPDEQRGHHGGIHPAGQGQQHLLLPHLTAHGRDLFLDKGQRGLPRRDPLQRSGARVRVHLHILPLQ